MKEKKWRKRLTAILICAVLGFNASAVYAQDDEDVLDQVTQENVQISGEEKTKENQQYDITKPVIEKVEFPQQGQTLKEGDTVRLYVYAYDMESGIQDIWVNGYIKNSSHFSMECSYDEKMGRYILEHTIDYASGNKLYIDDITVVDKNGNHASWTTYDPEKGDYTIWADIEWQKPEAVEVHIMNFEFKQNGQEINEESVLELSLETEEVIESECIFACFEYERFGGTLNIPLTQSGSSGQVFKNSGFRIGYDNTNAANGKWTLSGLYIDASPGNEVELRAENIDLENYYYTFATAYSSESKEDMEEPVITRVEVEENGGIFRAGESIHILVYSSDNEGLRPYGSVILSATSDFFGNVNYVNMFYNEEIGAYEGEFKVTDETYPCEWYISDIHIYDTSDNMADDDSYTDGADFPYYINIINGSTHIRPTYDLYIDFLVLDQDGNWKSAQQVHKEGIERRQTLQEAGVVFPEVQEEYPGIKQLGWVDADGNEISGDTQCMNSGDMTVYARYDKRSIDLQCKFLAENAEVSYEFRKIMVPEDITVGELSRVIESAEAPESSYSGMTFQKWKLTTLNGYHNAEDYNEQDILPWNPYLTAEANAMYGDLNVMNVSYLYLNADGGCSWNNCPVIYKKGNTYEAVIGMFQSHEPGDISKEYVFDEWQYTIHNTRKNWTGDTVTDDSDNMAEVECIAKFAGKTMLQAEQWFYNKNGYLLPELKGVMIDEGITYDNAQKELEKWEAPENCEGMTFKKWKIDDLSYLEHSKKLENGQHIRMTAVYDGSPVVPQVPQVPQVPGGIEKPETDPSEKDENHDQPEEVLPTEQQGIELPEEKISQIVEIIDKAVPGEPIHVDMAEATVIPKEILEAAKGKNIGITLDMGGYSWEINGRDIASNALESIDLKVIMDTDNIPSKTIQALAGGNPIQQLSLVHEGEFGFKAVLTVNVGNDHAGEYGNLYYHDSEGKLVFIDAGQISSSGNVSLTFSHASDYMIVMSDKQMSQADVPQEFVPNTKPNGSQNQNGSSGGQSQNGNGSGNETSSGNKNQYKNEVQSQTGNNSGEQVENNGQNEKDAAQNMTETNSQNQLALNDQNQVQNKSVKTGDELGAIPLILTSMLSLGVVVYMLKKKKS